MKQKLFRYSAVLFFVILLLAWWLLRRQIEKEQTMQVMGTVAGVSFTGRPGAVPNAIAKVETVFAEVQNEANLYNLESELSRLNAQAANAPFACSEELYSLLKIARTAYEKSDGAFDITSKPLMDLWGFYRKRGKGKPAAEEISAVIQLVGLNKVQFNDEARTIFFTVPGMALDLGGIAKGYAVDRAFDAVSQTGVKTGVINLGGNIRLLPEPKRGHEGYRIGIRNPLDPDSIAETLILNNCALATSGGYERFVTYDGIQYPHIMDPRTGMPASGLLAVTVVALDAVSADWMGTAVFINGATCAEKLAALYPGTKFYLYTQSDAPEGYAVEIIPHAP